MILLPPTGVQIKSQIFYFFFQVFWLPEMPLDEGRYIRDVLKEMQITCPLPAPSLTHHFVRKDQLRKQLKANI